MKINSIKKKKIKKSRNSALAYLESILLKFREQKAKKVENNVSLLLKKNNEKRKKEKTTYKFQKEGFSKKSLLNFKNKSFFEACVKVDAFIGDTYLRSHFTQDSFIYASRNNHDIYEAHSSYASLKRAMQFLRMQKNRTLIFVGNPSGTSEKCKAMFANHKVKFFASDLWVPGFISKNIGSKNSVLVIYDTSSNIKAKNEALSLNLPVVGFVTKYGNIDGVDYPVPINLEKTGSWYPALWNAFFSGKLETQNKKQ